MVDMMKKMMMMAMSILTVIVVDSSSLISDSCLNLTEWTVGIHSGNGTGTLFQNSDDGCDGIIFRANGSMSASLYSPKMTIDAPGHTYETTFTLSTKNLIPIDGGPSSGAATLTGNVYLHFFDINGDSGAWNPQFGTLAPANAENLQVTANFTAPTTAATFQIHLAFAAHTFTYSPNRMLGGQAKGEARMSSLRIKDLGKIVNVPNATISVEDETIQSAVDQAFKCLHNSKQSGNFTVGAGYTISGNISPDLTFGLHGIRRTNIQSYVNQISKQWDWHSPDVVSGKYNVGRVMGQINWPLGVDQIFSYTGNMTYLESRLPLVDKSLSYVNDRTDNEGLVTLVEVGHGRMGGGADWVDWYPESRLDGRTFQFHVWYFHTLNRFSNLHSEFSDTFGNATLAKVYADRAQNLRRVLLERYWSTEHWNTNPDYEDQGEWMDDTVWSQYFNVTNESISKILWTNIDRNRSFFEAVPIRWTRFETAHGACSWFGRLGAGDIMSRYRSGQNDRAFALLSKFSAIVSEQHDIYEGYDMNACGLQKCGCTTSGYGDYLEHCGGLIWSVVDGLFGWNFESKSTEYVASIEPRFPSSWSKHSEMVTTLRGL
eukprot:g7129.t1